MKTFISSEDFQRVLELLGLPGETLRIEIYGRNDYDMLMTGVDSSWGMKAVITEPGSYDDKHNQLEPYAHRVVYVPVMLPGDEERNARRLQDFDERHGPLVNHWSAWLTEDVTEKSPVKACLPIPYPPVTSRPSSASPETPFAATNPGTGVYGDGPYLTSEERESIRSIPSPNPEASP